MKKICLVILILSIIISKELHSQCPFIGSGTKSNPYQIWTVDDFRIVDNDDCRQGRDSVHYLVKADIGPINQLLTNIPVWMHIDGN